VFFNKYLKLFFVRLFNQRFNRFINDFQLMFSTLSQAAFNFAAQFLSVGLFGNREEYL